MSVLFEPKGNNLKGNKWLELCSLSYGGGFGEKRGNKWSISVLLRQTVVKDQWCYLGFSQSLVGGSFYEIQ